MNGALFGLHEREVLPLVTAVAPPGGDDDWRERFARAAWTNIAEPGDATAGALIGALGAAPALDHLLARARDGQDHRRGSDPRARPPEHASTTDRVPRSEPARTTDAAAVARNAEIAAGDLPAAYARWSPRVSARTVIRSLEQAARFDLRFSMPGDPGWPDRLADLGPCAPVGLWTKGDPSRLAATARSIAVVGARASSGYGEHVTVEIASGLADRGVVVVSGGAYGVDAAAHRAALAAEAPTVSILAGGLDRHYPAAHDRLFGQIAATGLLLSEVPCGVAPTRWRFLNRNRVIAALSAATLVVEAGRRSGSLNTAGHAAALGRPLGAVPGPVTSGSSAGCHRLLREYDAVCVTGVEDAMELLGFSDSPTLPSADPAPVRSETQVRVLDALRTRSPRTASEVASLAGLSLGDVLSALGGLDLAGVVRRGDDGGWIRRRGSSLSA